MKAKEITVSLRRVVQPKQFESYEISFSATVEVDPEAKLGDSIERIHKLMVGKLNWAVAEAAAGGLAKWESKNA